MNAIRTTAIALLTCLPLLACSDNSPTPADVADAPETMIGKAVKQATDEARQELANGNITLSRNGSSVDAEITPKGDLLVGGKAVAIDETQRTLLLEYRGQIVNIAEAGIGIGIEGADLAGKAVGEALKGVFTGNTDQIEQKIEAEAKGIEQAATKLCERLPALLDAQNRLAAALPAFQPYAKMDQTDVDECGKDGNFNVDIPGTTINADIAGDADAGNAAAEAEAASTDAK